MKKIIASIIILISCLIFTNGCQNEISFNTVKINSLYSLDLPEFMKPIQGMNNDASLQYGSLERNISVVVIPDKISDVNAMLDGYFKAIALDENTHHAQDSVYGYGFDGYCSMVMYNTHNNCRNFHSIKTVDSEINDMKCRIYEYTAIFENDTTYIQCAVYQGVSYYYQVQAMTNKINIKANADYIQRIVRTLKEL